MKKLPVFFPLILFAMSLMACTPPENGGGEVVELTAEIEETEEVVEVVVEVVTSEVEPVPPEATAAGPETGSGDAEEDAGESASPEAESTEVPAEEQISTPTAVSTQAPAATQEGEGSGWGESGTGPQTACDHGFLPIREGAYWLFSGEEGEMSWEVTGVLGDLSSATANVRITANSFVVDHAWFCNLVDGIVSYFLSSPGMAQLGPEFTVHEAVGEGIFLPLAEQLVPGATWDFDAENSSSFLQESADQTVEVNGRISTTQTLSIVSDLPVSFDDATVDGIQIEQNSIFSLNMDFPDSPVTQTFEVLNLHDLAWGIGIVRQYSESEFGVDTLDLVDYFVP